MRCSKLNDYNSTYLVQTCSHVSACEQVWAPQNHKNYVCVNGRKCKKNCSLFPNFLTAIFTKNPICNKNWDPKFFKRIFFKFLTLKNENRIIVFVRWPTFTYDFSTVDFCACWLHFCAACDDTLYMYSKNTVTHNTKHKTRLKSHCWGLFVFIRLFVRNPRLSPLFLRF